MQKQAVTRTANKERLRELYASAKTMTAGTIFGTGNGLLQEEVRDEVRAREQRKLSKLNANVRKKKKSLWKLCLEVESAREDTALKYRDYLLTKGFPPSHEVKESDLTEDQIRNLRNDHLQTLCKWKKISRDEAMPTKKADLAARLIAMMGRMSPDVSPYNSEDEEDYEGDVAVHDTDDADNADEGEPYYAGALEGGALEEV